MHSENKARLMELLHGRAELVPLIHDILAENQLSEEAYAQVFQLVFSSKPNSSEDEVSFCRDAKEWVQGGKPLSGVKLFCVLNQVCDIIRFYTLASWEECIFSAWGSDKEVLAAQEKMHEMESIAHMRSVLKLSAENMLSCGAEDASVS